MYLNKYCLRRVVCFLVVVSLLCGVTAGALSADEINQMPASHSFADIEGHWAYYAIDFMFERGFMQGTSPTIFAPNLPVSRAMVATILYRVAGKPEAQFRAVFNDVAAGQWYSDAVIWMYDHDAVNGIGGGYFAPSANITREEIATILHRFAIAQGYEVEVTFASNILLDFADAHIISDWAKVAMEWVVHNEFIIGTDLGALNPRATATRGEAVTMFMRFIEQAEHQPQLPSAEDFVLTISVEEATLPQGNNFSVHVELRNDSGRDLEISHFFLFWPHILGWDRFEGRQIVIDLPPPRIM